MSEQHSSQPAGVGPETQTPARRCPRVWPAAVILALQFLSQWVYAKFSTTNVQSGIELGAFTLFGTLLLIVWWLGFSRTPWRDRLLGVALFVAAVAAVVLSQANAAYGAMLLVYAVPRMLAGVVALLLVTAWLRWPVRRWVLVVYIIGCCAAHMAMRFESVGGNLAPEVSWRWNPSRLERSGAMARPGTQGTAALPEEVADGDYPAFRGPARDGRLAGVAFSTDWAAPPREVWRREVGPGWSSFIAVGDYLFTQEQRGPEEVVSCYHAGTGEEVWTNGTTALFDDDMGIGPRATPTYDRGRLYTQGATGILQCLDAATGATVWKRDLKEDAGCGVPGYGFTSSPLVTGGLVVAFTCGPEGKSAAAYDTATGDIAWFSGHKSTAYSSPQLVDIGGVPQILLNGEWGLQSLNPETGALLWGHPWSIKTFPIGTQAVVFGDTFLIGATGTTGSRIVKAEKKGEEWETAQVAATKLFRPYFNNSVEHKGYCYGYDDQRIACISMETGERRWQGEKWGGQLLLLADMDLLLVLTEKGQVVLLKADPERLVEVARFQALKGKTWNHPIIAHGRLYVRNSEEAACFQLN
ncbi:MAG: PQQ-like beta-propeller repeat protein [Candidatus Hydrogenedens sp.]|nr:PQQ-binding-like beta-propeller repeat protein [Candidatus Hydrogenedentota bacterium]NLF57673.1 PQQ-like beta-propeller repeat protein [Candidatus Hydrogenedens sp.]